MIQVLLNIVKLYRIVMERGNWKLIQHCQGQLKDFIFCRSGLNRKSPIQAIFYWYGLLKGLDMLIWRLETFGFIFPAEVEKKNKFRLNRYL